MPKNFVTSIWNALEESSNYFKKKNNNNNNPKTKKQVHKNFHFFSFYKP